MNFDKITIDKDEARQKWKEYKEAEKLSKSIPGQEGVKYRSVYKELGKIYHAMKQGKVLIDIRQVIKAGGIKKPGYPAFAIAKATWQKVTCRYSQNGSLRYEGPGRARFDIQLVEGTLPTFTMANRWDNMSLQAPVPLIPPKYRPAHLTEDYYILWEVDEWKQVPSADPYLLKRLTKDHFILLEGWDLTPLEISVMQNYL
jgi:hypothetical protein